MNGLAQHELERLAFALGSWYPPRRRHAAELLAGAGLKAVPVLAELACRGTGRARLGAVRLLAESDEPRALRALISALRDRSQQVRQVAIQAVGRHRVREVVPLLAEVVRTGAPGCREEAVRALGRIGDAAATPVLVETILRDVLRGEAAEALGMIGDARAIPALAGLLDDVYTQEFPRAAIALSRMRHPDAAAALVNCCAHRRSTMPALRKPLRRLGAAAVPALIEALDQDREMVVYASELLRELWEHAVPALMEAVVYREGAPERGSWRRRAHAAQVLAAIGRNDGGPALLLALGDPSAEVRYEAATALGELRSSSACSALRALLADEQPSNRCAAAVALVSCGVSDEVLIPALLAGLDRGRVESLRVRSIDALAQMARLAPVPALRTALPRLRAVARPVANTPEERAAAVAAVRQIELATREIAGLPLPAEGRMSNAHQLPRPVDSPTLDPECRPRPASAPPSTEAEFYLP